MKNLKYLIMKISAILIILALVTFSIITFNKPEKIEGRNFQNEIIKDFYSEPSSEFVKKKLAEMTLREKIAQMVVANAVPENFQEGSAELEKFRKLCEETKVGGFIFFKGSSSDFARLSNIL